MLMYFSNFCHFHVFVAFLRKRKKNIDLLFEGFVKVWTSFSVEISGGEQQICALERWRSAQIVSKELKKSPQLALSPQNRGEGI